MLFSPVVLLVFVSSRAVVQLCLSQPTAAVSAVSPPAECPAGWSLLAIGRHQPTCLRFFPADPPLPFKGALEQCKKMGAQMAQLLLDVESAGAKGNAAKLGALLALSGGTAIWVNASSTSTSSNNRSALCTRMELQQRREATANDSAASSPLHRLTMEHNCTEKLAYICQKEALPKNGGTQAHPGESEKTVKAQLAPLVALLGHLMVGMGAGQNGEAATRNGTTLAGRIGATVAGRKGTTLADRNTETTETAAQWQKTQKATMGKDGQETAQRTMPVQRSPGTTTMMALFSATPPSPQPVLSISTTVAAEGELSLAGGEWNVLDEKGGDDGRRNADGLATTASGDGNCAERERGDENEGDQQQVYQFSMLLVIAD